MFETCRRAHVNLTFSKPYLAWNARVPDEREVDDCDLANLENDVQWYKVTSNFGFRLPSTVLVEEVVIKEDVEIKETAKPHEERSSKKSKVRFTDAPTSSHESRSVKDDSYSGVVRRLELSTEGFWEFLFSDRWEDTCLLRVLDGELLNNLLAAMYLLERDHDVISYVTIAYIDNPYPRVPCMKNAHTDKTYTIDIEQVLVELDYFGPERRNTDDANQSQSTLPEGIPPDSLGIEGPFTKAELSATKLPSIKCNIRGIKYPPPHDFCHAPYHMVREPFHTRRLREQLVFPPVQLPHLQLTPLPPNLRSASVHLGKKGGKACSKGVASAHDTAFGPKDEYELDLVGADPYLERLPLPPGLEESRVSGLRLSSEHDTSKGRASKVQLKGASAKKDAAKKKTTKEDSDDDPEDDEEKPPKAKLDPQRIRRQEEDVWLMDTYLIARKLDERAQNRISMQARLKRSLRSKQAARSPSRDSTASTSSEKSSAEPGTNTEGEFNPLVHASAGTVSNNGGRTRKAQKLTESSPSIVTEQPSDSKCARLKRWEKCPTFAEFYQYLLEEADRALLLPPPPKGKNKKEEGGFDWRAEMGGFKDKAMDDVSRAGQGTAQDKDKATEKKEKDKKDNATKDKDVKDKEKPEKGKGTKEKADIEGKEKEAPLKETREKVKEPKEKKQAKEKVKEPKEKVKVAKEKEVGEKKKKVKEQESSHRQEEPKGRKAPEVKQKPSEKKTSQNMGNQLTSKRDRENEKKEETLKLQAGAKTDGKLMEEEVIRRSGLGISCSGVSLLTEKQLELVRNAGLILSAEDPWHVSDHFAYLAGGVCDSIGVRNALLQRRARIYEMIESGKLLLQMNEARLWSLVRAVSPDQKGSPRGPFEMRTSIRVTPSVAGEKSSRKKGQKGKQQSLDRGGGPARDTDSVPGGSKNGEDEDGKKDEKEKGGKTDRKDDDGKKKDRGGSKDKADKIAGKDKADKCASKDKIKTDKCDSKDKADKGDNKSRKDKDGDTTQKDKAVQKAKKDKVKNTDDEKSKTSSKDNKQDKKDKDSDTAKKGKGDRDQETKVGETDGKGKKGKGKDKGGLLVWKPGDEIPDDITEEDLFRLMGFLDIFDPTKLKSSYSFEKMFAHQPSIKPNYEKLLKVFSRPYKGKLKPKAAPSKQKLKTKSRSDEQADTEVREETPPPAELSPPPLIVLGKLREFGFLKHRDHVRAPPGAHGEGLRNAMSVEELRDRLQQAMKMFVVRKERATTTRLFQSKVSVTFTRRERADGGGPFMADSRRVVAGVCRTLSETLSETHSAALVPC